MADESFRKHIERLKGLAEGSIKLPRLKHNFIRDGKKVSKVRDQSDFAWELSEIGKATEKNAKIGKEGANKRLEIYKEVVEGKKEKAKKSD